MPPTTRLSRVPALLVAAVVLLAGCIGGDPTPPPTSSSPVTPPSGVEPAMRAYYTQQLSWEGCGSDLQCTTVRVPLDYDDPGGDAITLAVLRRPADDQDRRIGSLLVNPGGPGSSGTSYAEAGRAAFGRPLLERFDIVGFDPRGVGESSPVDCLPDDELDAFLALDFSPDTPAERDALAGASEAFAAACAEASGELLRHVGTVDAARDMDVLRAVLGDEKLNYLGKSYGTYLGAVYADLFPQNVGRLVLDGALDPTVDGLDLAIEQAEGFERVLDAFIDDCIEEDDCPLGAGRTEARATLTGLMAALDERPLPGDGDRLLTESLATLGIALPLYLPGGDAYEALRVALRGALGGDGSDLLVLADLYLERRDGAFIGNQNEAIYAVNCLDAVQRPSEAAIAAAEGRFRAASPVFGPYVVWSGLPCASWPAPPTASAGPLTAAGADPILVVGTTGDPATPYDWAVGLADQMSSAVLLTYEGTVHTAYGFGSSCIDDAVEGYLLDGDVPEDGKRCD